MAEAVKTTLSVDVVQTGEAPSRCYAVKIAIGHQSFGVSPTSLPIYEEDKDEKAQESALWLAIQVSRALATIVDFRKCEIVQPE